MTSIYLSRRVRTLSEAITDMRRTTRAMAHARAWALSEDLKPIHRAEQIMSRFRLANRLADYAKHLERNSICPKIGYDRKD